MTFADTCKENRKKEKNFSAKLFKGNWLKEWRELSYF